MASGAKTRPQDSSQPPVKRSACGNTTSSTRCGRWLPDCTSCSRSAFGSCWSGGHRSRHHAHVIADLALRIQDHVADKEFGGHPITFRIGINSGPVVAGVIGRQKFAYDLWGDVVNTASRMESTGTPGRTQVSAATYDLLRNEFLFDTRAETDIKGKGVMKTWLLNQRTLPDVSHTIVPGQASSPDHTRT